MALSSELAQEVEPKPEFLEVRLKELYELRDAIRTLQLNEKRLSELMRFYLERHPEEQLRDGEHGIVARLQTRSGSDSYDVASMPDALVLRLRDLKALDVDKKVLKALDGKSIEALDAKKYRIPGGVTYALLVEKE